SALVYDVVWTGTVPQTTALLVMTARPAADQKWSFGAEFPGLPEYTGSDHGAITRKSSFFNTIVINELDFTVATYTDPGDTFVPGLSLAGKLDAKQGDLAPIGKWIPDAMQLPLRGGIVVRSGKYALITFAAAVNLD